MGYGKMAFSAGAAFCLAGKLGLSRPPAVGQGTHRSCPVMISNKGGKGSGGGQSNSGKARSSSDSCIDACTRTCVRTYVGGRRRSRSAHDIVSVDCDSTYVAYVVKVAGVCQGNANGQGGSCTHSISWCPQQRPRHSGGLLGSKGSGISSTSCVRAKYLLPYLNNTHDFLARTQSPPGHPRGLQARMEPFDSWRMYAHDMV